MDTFATFNAAYVAGFGDHRPARSTIAVRELPAGGQVEIEAVVLQADELRLTPWPEPSRSSSSS